MTLDYFLDHLKGHTKAKSPKAPKDSAYCFFSLRNLFIFQENTIFFSQNTQIKVNALKQ